MNGTTQPEFDVTTSAGGRSYIAHLFENVMKRRDFAQYIREDLAADFACTLAAHLSAASEPVNEELERKKFEAACGVPDYIFWSPYSESYGSSHGHRCETLIHVVQQFEGWMAYARHRAEEGK